MCKKHCCKHSTPAPAPLVSEDVIYPFAEGSVPVVGPLNIDVAPVELPHTPKDIDAVRERLAQPWEIPPASRSLVAEPRAAASRDVIVSRVNITPVQAGLVISAPGTYTLTGGFTYAAAPGLVAIKITASNVTLDLRSNTLTGPGTSQVLGDAALGIVVASGVSNIIIKNGRVTKFSTGVQIGNDPSLALITTNVQLTNVNLSGQVGAYLPFGFEPFGPGTTAVAAVSIAIFDAVNRLTISNCQASNNTSPTPYPDNANLPDNPLAPPIPIGVYAVGLSAYRVASISNLLVQNSNFNGHLGSQASGVVFDSAPLTTGTFTNCNFNNNSDLNFPGLFGDDIFSGINNYKESSGALIFQAGNAIVNTNVNFTNCSASGNTSDTKVTGIELNNVNISTISNCQCSNNINSGNKPFFGNFAFQFPGFAALMGYAGGISMIPANNVTIINCNTNNNRSVGGEIENWLAIFGGPATDPNLVVRAVGVFVGNGTNATVQNTNATGNLVQRPGVNDAKGLGIATFQMFDNGPVYTNLTITSCNTKSNQYGFGFSNANIVTMSSATNSLNSEVGLYLNTLGFVGGPNLEPVATNFKATNCSFGNNVNGVVSAVVSQTYINTFAANCSVCNWTGVPGKTCSTP